MPPKKDKSVFPRKILVDTNFLISLVNANEIYHQNAKEYFKQILEDEATLWISAIVWSEFSKNRDAIFPIMENFKFIAFQVNDAEKVWEIFDIQFYKEKGSSPEKICLKDDFKITAQAIARDFDAIITSDNDFAKILKDHESKIQIIDFKKSSKEFLGKLF